MTDAILLRSRPGFSLIEVLVALAILGIALGAMMPRISLGSLAAERASRTEEAVLLAEQLLTEAGRTIPLPSKEAAEGKTRPPVSPGGSRHAASAPSPIPPARPPPVSSMSRRMFPGSP